MLLILQCRHIYKPAINNCLFLLLWSLILWEFSHCFHSLSCISFCYQPRVPESEHATADQSEIKKTKRSGKPTVDEAKPENRQPPPKPPRKAKLSVEDVVYDAPMENDVENDLYAPTERNGELEGKKDGARKRNMDDGARFDEFGSYEKASVQDSLGRYDDCVGNGDVATKKKKQSRKVNYFPLHIKIFYSYV